MATIRNHFLPQSDLNANGWSPIEESVRNHLNRLMTAEATILAIFASIAEFRRPEIALKSSSSGHQRSLARSGMQIEMRFPFSRPCRLLCGRRGLSAFPQASEIFSMYKHITYTPLETQIRAKKWTNCGRWIIEWNYMNINIQFKANHQSSSLSYSYAGLVAPIIVINITYTPDGPDQFPPEP